MNDKALMKETIEAWEEKYALAKRGTAFFEIPFGPATCPLCGKYNSDYLSEGGGCFGCPIAIYTGLDFCKGTPYDIIIDDFKSNSELIKLIEAELVFLKRVDKELTEND